MIPQTNKRKSFSKNTINEGKTFLYVSITMQMIIFEREGHIITTIYPS